MSIQNSRDIGDVKVMLLKGEEGSNIESVTKTGTSGLVDTYTITLTDGSKTTFNVTNGRAIVSVEKTSSQGLVDTYTITFNDGTYIEVEFEKANVNIDTELSTTSTNPVENRVITSRINTIESDVDALETDTANIQTQIVPSTSIEETSTASQAYSVGVFLTYQGQLCKVTTAIAQGDTLTIGTNIEYTNVGTQLEELKSENSMTIPAYLVSWNDAQGDSATTIVQSTMTLYEIAPNMYVGNGIFQSFTSSITPSIMLAIRTGNASRVFTQQVIMANIFARSGGSYTTDAVPQYIGTNNEIYLRKATGYNWLPTSWGSSSDYIEVSCVVRIP